MNSTTGDNSADALHTVEGVAVHTHCSVGTVYRWLRNGLPAVHFGPRCVRIRESDLAAFVARLREEDAQRRARGRPRLAGTQTGQVCGGVAGDVGRDVPVGEGAVGALVPDADVGSVLVQTGEVLDTNAPGQTRAE